MESATRVVDQHVDVVERLRHLGKPARDLRAIADVEDTEVRRASKPADLVGALAEVLDITVADGHVGAEARQRGGRRPSDPHRRARDDGHPAVESHIVRSESHGAEVSGGGGEPDAPVIC